MIFPSRVLSAGTHTLTPSDSIILADTTDGIVTINLPSIVSVIDFMSKQGGSLGGMIQFPFTIVDVAGNASVNNILIIPFGGDRYSGAYWTDLVPTITINQNGGSASFKPVYGNIWGVNMSGIGGGNPSVSVKMLIMKLNQSERVAPSIVSIGQNDFGITPTFNYISSGVYEMTMSDTFIDENKVFFLQKQLGASIDGGGKLRGTFVKITVVDKNTLRFTTFIDNHAPADNLMSLHDVEIMVFS